MNDPHRGLPHTLSSGFSLIVRISDIVVIGGTLYVLNQLFNVFDSTPYQYAALLAIIFYFLTAEFGTAFYSSRLENYGDIVGKVIVSWAITSIALFLVAFITKTSAEFSRMVILLWFCITPLCLLIERFFVFIVFKTIQKKFGKSYTYAILGDPLVAQGLTQKIGESAWRGLQLKKIYTELEPLLQDLESESIDYVFLCYEAQQHEKIVAATQSLNNSTASTYLVPDLLMSELLGSRWIMLGNTPLVVINDHPLYGGWWALKRLEDLSIGSLILIMSLPLMLSIALAIKVSSRGPIIFKQRRHGLNGEVISVYKFRTMHTLDDGAIVVQATKNDERVTPIGKFLRRTSLDELPQFFNVLQGNMSIVGPRPHALAHNEYYRQLIDGYMQRHKVKPGITGWAQINGLRGETDTIEKMRMRVEYDLYYINHWSLGLDLKIILLTAIKGLGGKMVY